MCPIADGTRDHPIATAPPIKPSTAPIIYPVISSISERKVHSNRTRPVVEVDFDQRLRRREEWAGQQIKLRRASAPTDRAEPRKCDQPRTRSYDTRQIDVRFAAVVPRQYDPDHCHAGDQKTRRSNVARIRPPCRKPSEHQPGNRRQPAATPCPPRHRLSCAVRCPFAGNPDALRQRSQAARTSTHTRSANCTGSVLDLNTDVFPVSAPRHRAKRSRA